MEILDTLVTREITLISNNYNIPSSHKWELYIKANGKVFKVYYVKDLKLDRLYHMNFTDELRVTVGVMFGDLQQGIVPYKDALEVELIYIPQYSMNINEVARDGKMVKGVYKAHLNIAGADSVAGDNPLTVAKEKSNQHILDIELQLYSKTIDDIKKKTFGTTFRDTPAIDAVVYVLLKYSVGESNDPNTSVLGVSLDETFEKLPRTHIVVKHDTLVTDVPHVIDDVVGGLHPAQMRYYLQDRFWYIYPILDHKRWGSNQPSLTVIKIPKHRLQNVDRSYRLSGENLIILTTKETVHQDHSESKQLNEGNGVRFLDARTVMDGLVETQDNKAVIQASDSMTEVAYEERKDGSNFITGGGAKITDKYNKEYARMAMMSGAYIQTYWENADVNLLKPGMPVRYIFQDGETTRELYGTLNAVETLDYNTNNTIKEPRFNTLALLTIFVSKKNPLAKEDSVSSVTETKTT